MTQQVWHRCLSQLELELSEEQLNTWIRPLQADEQNSYLRLMAPNQFVLNWVENNFYGRIKEIVTALSEPEQLTVALEIGSGFATTAASAMTTPVGSNGVARATGPDDFNLPANSASGPGPATGCLLYTSPSPRDATLSRMPSSA